MGVIDRGSRLYYILAIIVLISPSYAPFASASVDGVSIINSTISLEDFDKIEDSNYELGFDIEVIGTPSETTSYVNISFTMETISGALISNSIQNYSLSAGELIQVSQNFSEVQFGYVVILVSMSGDVAASSPTHISSFQRTLQRLNPLDISVGQSDAIIIEGIDSTGLITGNLSVNDGDYIQLQIPVINSGDFDWNGFITINISDTEDFENVTSQLISVTAMQTSIYFFNSTIKVHEGQINIHLTLNNSGDGDITDETSNFNFLVSPPPLPIISLLLEEVTTEIIAGEDMFWNLKVSNSGDVEFNGNITCDFDQFSIMNNSLVLNSSSHVNISISTSARPGTLKCMVLDDRISQSSQFEINLSLVVESAEFETAGGDIPATLLGPWHEGDDVRLSILVRNHGSKLGNVKMVCEVLGITYSGDSIELGVDEAGETFVDVPMMSNGLQMLNWSLQSADGAIDSGLFGELNISVSQRQTLEISIQKVSWDEQEGLSFDWGVTLSEGIERDVRVRLGYVESLEETFLIDSVISLNPGLTEGSINLGLIDAEKVIIRADEDNWVAGFGFSYLSLDTPQDRSIYTISFETQTTPNRPTAGESAKVVVNLENTGIISGSQGILILKTSAGTLIEERAVSSLGAQSSKTEQFTFDWPKGDEVSLIATWEVSEQIYKAEEIFISSVIQNEDDSSQITDYLPGVLGGVALAVVVILIARVINSKQRDAPVKEKKKTTTTPEESKSTISEIKIQIGCPECSRQLKVPSNYSGSVRCPDCNNSFEVEDEQEVEQDEVIQEQVVEEQEADDGKIEVGCPECSQTLRIPNSYSGSVRCPACKNIFRA